MDKPRGHAFAHGTQPVPSAEPTVGMPKPKPLDLLVAVSAMLLMRYGMPGLLGAVELPAWAHRPMHALMLVLFPGLLLGLALWVYRRGGMAQPFADWRASKLFGEWLTAIPITVALVMFHYGMFALFDRDAFAWAKPIMRSADLLTLGVWMAMAITLTPVAEEVFFRGVVLRGLERWMPMVGVALIQAVLFSVVHGYGWFERSLLVVDGVVLAACWWWRGSLALPVMVHLNVNLVATGTLIFLYQKLAAAVGV